MSESVVPTPVLTRTKADLREAMNLLTREIFASLACAQAGTIQSYDGEAQTAGVTINSKITVGYQTGLTGQIQPVAMAYPLFPDVPVIFLGGGGGALTFPVAAGDTCLLIFLDRDMSNWYVSGQTDLTPASNRLHSLSDAVALVGLRSSRNPLEDVSDDSAELYGPEGHGGPLLSLGAGKVGISNATGSLLTVMTTLVAALTALNAKTGPDASAAITAFQSAEQALLK